MVFELYTALFYVWLIFPICRQKYRISTHPDFVTYDKPRLLEHPDADIRELSKRLP